MERATAELMMKELLALSQPLNAATALTDQIADRAEREQFRRELAALMGDIYIDLIKPIIKQYPDLDPDRRKTP